MTCFKGVIRLQNYQYLKIFDSSEYKAISKIHTAHTLIIENKEYSFNGKGKIGCMDDIPESTFVTVNANVYSFYSKKINLGQFIILNSIKKQFETIKKHKPMGIEPLNIYSK